MYTILLLDHTSARRTLLCEALQQAGYRTLTASDGVAGIALARSATPDLILVHLLLPRINGCDVCSVLRIDRDVPIIMLNDCYDEQRCIASFEAGANDFVAPPCSTAELVARMRALLRWHPRVSPAALATPLRQQFLTADSLRVDLASRQVWRAGNEVALTHQEFELLIYMLQRGSGVLSRDQLLADVWPNAALVQPRTVDVHIYTLRMKIEDDPTQPRFIHTVRGAGYRFQIPARTAHQDYGALPHGYATQRPALWALQG